MITELQIYCSDFTHTRTLFLFIKDQGNPSMSTAITLTVNVLDQLESATMFTQDIYQVSIAEGTYTMVCTSSSSIIIAL